MASPRRGWLAVCDASASDGIKDVAGGRSQARIVMIEFSTKRSLTEDAAMPDPVNLTGEIAAAIDGAALRGHQLALAYVRDDGSPSVSFRGSTYVRSSTELAILGAEARQWPGRRDQRPSTRLAGVL